MCHHYRANKLREMLAENANLQLDWLNEFSLRANLYQLTLPLDGFYPLAKVPAVRVNDAGERELVPIEWGFLPAWWKPSDKTPKRAVFQRKCINARSEDVDCKPTYRDSFRRRRCLMPADEFFERGHYFHLANHKLFAFAALWDRWRDSDGQTIDTCTLLTTAPNEAVQSVGHTRMPVILTSEEQYARWLNPEVTERRPLDELLQATPTEWWSLYPAKESQPTHEQTPQQPPRQGQLF